MLVRARHSASHFPHVVATVSADRGCLPSSLSSLTKRYGCWAMAVAAARALFWHAACVPWIPTVAVTRHNQTGSPCFVVRILGTHLIV